MVTKQKKAELVEKFGENLKDTGKSQVQIAILSARIADLTRHLIKHPKDYHTRRGMIALVSKRRRLLNYLVATDINAYRSVIAELQLRK